MAKLMLPDVALHYQCLGEGDDVVLIHGLGANLAFWYMGIARVLAQRYRVITYDLRGHGRSSMPAAGYTLPDMVRDLHSLLDHLQSPRAHIVGHSFGARVALYYAIAHSDRVASLTVADTQVQSLQAQVRLREWPYWPTWKRQLMQEGFDALPADNELITFRLLVHFNQLTGNLAQATQRNMTPSLKRRDMGLKGSARWQQLMNTSTARDELDDDHQLTPATLRQITVPTLAMYGEYSHCLKSCKRLKELIDHCRVTIIPKAGHFHPAVKPRHFTRILRGWLLSVRALDEGRSSRLFSRIHNRRSVYTLE